MSIRLSRLRSRKAEITKRDRWLPCIMIWEIIGLKTLIGDFQIKWLRNLSQHRLSSYLGEITFFDCVVLSFSHVTLSLMPVVILINSFRLRSLFAYRYTVYTVPMHSWKMVLIFHHDAVIDRDLVSRLCWLILSVIIKYLWRLLSVLATYQISAYIYRQ